MLFIGWEPIELDPAYVAQALAEASRFIQDWFTDVESVNYFCNCWLNR